MTDTVRIVKGDDAVISIPVVDADGAAVTLTGALAATFKAKTSATAGSTAISKTLGAGVAVSGSTVTVTLTDTDTGITAGDYVFEVQITDANGNISTVRDENDQPFKLKILEDLD